MSSTSSMTDLLRRLFQLQQRQKHVGASMPPLVDYIRHSPPSTPILDEWDPTNMGRFAGHAQTPITVRNSR